MAVAEVSIVWLPVTDINRAIGFYRDTLGMSEQQREAQWAQLEIGGLRIGLNQREDPSGDGGAVIAFQPKQGIEQAVEELRAEGVEFAGDISEHPWGRIASFKDPDGNDLQLYEPPAG